MESSPYLLQIHWILLTRYLRFRLGRCRLYIYSVEPTGCRFILVAAFLIEAATSPASAAVRFHDFASAEGLELVGAAKTHGRALRLTPAKHFRTGAAWLHQKQPVLTKFETTFQFRLTHPAWLGGGADGFAFVIQNSGPRALGGRGSAGGFALEDTESLSHRPRSDSQNSQASAIPWSVAIFFDTWQNNNEGDPSDNYIAVRTNGRPAQMHWPADRLAFTPDLAVELKDHKVHTARIVFHRPVLQVFLDNAPRPVLQTTLDLSLVADPQGNAWIGFTASTGWAFENHDILNWSFEGEKVSSDVSQVSSDISFPMAACLPNRNLCTPEHSFARAEGNTYHVVLPGNLEWGVRVPNPTNAAVAITNAHGIVCWDLKERGGNGCTGPPGSPGHAGAGFLNEHAPAGALISRTEEGSTLFSVNGETGPSFNDNEGFYEFDVQVK